MIAHLRGKLLELTPELALLDVQGVGYEVFISQTTHSELESVSTDLGLWIYTHVREDALTLFGFYTRFEKNLFLSLLKVNGIGPKMGMSILSGSRPEKILQMIEAGDVKALTALPKLGKKTAEQIILTLKGKLVLLDSEEKSRPIERHEPIRSALLNLGFKPQIVAEFVKTLPEEIEFEQGVRQGLQVLAAQPG
ncbi:MAG TPA: Holliday junction branch migration protein RuvA [Pseudobdellovibrionaceae bacterium]|nr:Holliday junction branch migration protein RuvA [Pseudobdellovibrionaceae bacterium]